MSKVIKLNATLQRITIDGEGASKIAFEIALSDLLQVTELAELTEVPLVLSVEAKSPTVGAPTLFGTEFKVAAEKEYDEARARERREFENK